MKTALLVSVILLFTIVVAWRLLRRRQSGEQKPLTALVFLLSEARTFADWQVRQAASRALGVELRIADEPEPNTIVPVPAEKVQPSLQPGSGKSYFINTGARQFLINSFVQPYMSEPEKFAESISDMRLARAVASHRAWISADVFGSRPSPEEREPLYAILGRMLVPFAADDCLAIYCPELGRCNEFAPCVVEKLQSGKPLELFDEPTFAPIVNVSSDDPRLVAAVNEARRRWPEFVDAFTRKPNTESPYVIKARFADGENEEFMWVSVNSIEGESIHGRLENSPAALTNLKEGDDVTVAFADLNDWMCEINGEAVGGFTMKVMSDVYHHVDAQPDKKT
jgi:Uncharacterized protein conserved in bacteria